MPLDSKTSIGRPFFTGVWKDDLFGVGHAFDEIRRFLERLQSDEIDTGYQIQGEQVSVSATYSIKDTDGLVMADATGGAFTATLPTAVGKKGKRYTVKRMNAGGNNVTAGTTGSETIDGAATSALTAQYESVTVVSDGSNYLIV